MNGFYVTTAIPYVNARTAPGTRAGAGTGRRARPAPPTTGTTGPLPDRHRRERAEERGRGAGGRARRRRLRGRQRRPVRRAARRRCRCRSTTSSAPAATRATAAGSSGCGGATPPTATSTGAATTGCTARAASSSTTPAELVDGRCPEHGTEPEAVAEENWFFRLCRYAGVVEDAIRSGRVRVEPATRRNEVLAFLAAGLADISVSRPAARSRGWGIPVPDDPEQVIYVWWDALANYVTALDDRCGDSSAGGSTPPSGST